MPSCRDLFKKYKNNINVFIETGSHIGNGIQAAIESNFNKIYSIELSQYFFNYCNNRFKNNHNVNLIFGDSSEKLEVILTNIKEPILYWLDGHFSGDNTSLGKKYSPLIEELETIKKYYIIGSIIIIDDLRCWKKGKDYDFDMEDLKNKLLDINPNFTFVLEDSYRDNQLLFKKDILVAI